MVADNENEDESLFSLPISLLPNLLNDNDVVKLDTPIMPLNHSIPSTPSRRGTSSNFQSPRVRGHHRTVSLGESRGSNLGRITRKMVTLTNLTRGNISLGGDELHPFSLDTIYSQRNISTMMNGNIMDTAHIMNPDTSIDSINSELTASNNLSVNKIGEKGKFVKKKHRRSRQNKIDRSESFSVIQNIGVKKIPEWLQEKIPCYSFKEKIIFGIILIMSIIGLIFGFLNKYAWFATIIISILIKIYLFYMQGIERLKVYENLKEKFSNNLSENHKNSLKLLDSIFPHHVAKALINGVKCFSEEFKNHSILFADICSFTPFSQKLTSSELIRFIQVVFGRYDNIIQAYQSTKVETIGDSMVVRADNEIILIRSGLSFKECVYDIRKDVEHAEFQIRLGCDTGDITGGVVSMLLPRYNIFGGTVVNASRMQTHADPGRFQITKKTYELVKHEFTCESRSVDVKGKGECVVYCVKMAEWFDNLNWDPYSVKDNELVYMIVEVLYKAGALEIFKCTMEELDDLVRDMISKYNDIPYHNKYHILNMINFIDIFLKKTDIRDYFQPIELLALFMSALGHDIDHKGHSNSWYIRNNHNWIQEYGRESVLENHHYNVYRFLLTQHNFIVKSGVLDKLLEMSKVLILATDFTKHEDEIGKLDDAINNPANTIIIIDDENEELDSLDNIIIDNNSRLILMKNILKFADLACNPSRPPEIYRKITRLLDEEFMMDRENSSNSNSANDELIERDYSEHINFHIKKTKPLFKILEKILDMGDISLLINRNIQDFII